MLKIGVVLAGCGRRDGSEIHESVLTLLFLDQMGAEAVCMASNLDQRDTINHLTDEPMDEPRNILVESARIARGNVRDIKTVSGEELDGLIIPGGAGAIKNLSDFAIKGAEAEVNEDVQRIINEMADAEKPIGAICIAPATLTKALAARFPEVTIGNDLTAAGAIGAMGGIHKDSGVEEIHVDVDNKLVTTPAYMLGPGIKEIAVGIEALVKKVLELTGGGFGYKPG
ncbi:MAG: isoprenoid biosynthesis glyoxalase ElbB [Desulfobacterales bacterium]|nr:isoprenoid biosynthesis glyoxalase ElbB [Desulfobacterales bacterium]